MSVPRQEICVGVGMPAALWLDEFGSQVWSAFGEPPYLVGSALHGKQWRDVDVRLILDDEAYAALGLGRPDQAHLNAKWVSLCMAYSALGRAMTGLPIDFQIQQQTDANAKFKESRSALGCIGLRIRESGDDKASVDTRGLLLAWERWLEAHGPLNEPADGQIDNFLTARASQPEGRNGKQL